MIDFGHYEYNGVTKKPKGLVFRKNGSFDKRYKVNKGWKYVNPINDMYAEKMLESVNTIGLLGRFLKRT